MGRGEDTESDEETLGRIRGGKIVAGQGSSKQIQGVSGKNKKKAATLYASKDGQGYAWEEEYKRSWDVLREDESGSLESSINQLIASKRKRLIRDTSSIQRGIIRHLCLIIDLSLAMTDRDLRPNRLEISLNYAKEFVTEFFDQNPIGQMCILTTKDGLAERLSGLSGNPLDHHKALSNKSKLNPSGEPSLQNSLEMARASLAHLPPHGSREVLVIFGSLTTCDPDDIHKTLEKLEKDRMRVSMVGLAAEVKICKEICKRTHGRYGVILNEEHFKELLFESISPPAIEKSSNSTSGPGSSSSNQASSLIQMGFPNKISHHNHSSNSTQNNNDNIAQHLNHSFCACHSKLNTTGFICPRCGSKNCEIPTNCSVCSLTIVSSPHLARSYRHLFPVGNWLENKSSNFQPNQIVTCFGCDKPIKLNNNSNNNNKSTATNTNSNINQQQQNNFNLFMCPRCKNNFCLDCDLYHEQLGLCPGCS